MNITSQFTEKEIKRLKKFHTARKIVIICWGLLIICFLYAMSLSLYRAYHTAEFWEIDTIWIEFLSPEEFKQIPSVAVMVITQQKMASIVFFVTAYFYSLLLVLFTKNNIYMKCTHIISELIKNEQDNPELPLKNNSC